MLIVRVLVCAGHGRMHAAEQRKDRASLEELIHSIQLESELTSRALKQTVSVSFLVCFTRAWASVHVSACCTQAWMSVCVSVCLAVPLYVCMFICCVVPLLSEVMVCLYEASCNMQTSTCVAKLARSSETFGRPFA